MKYLPKILDRRSPLFERVYKIGVTLKGIDGLIELLSGVLLIISPQLVHTILAALSSELGESHAHTLHFIAEYVARVDTHLAASGLVFLIVFLITHGLVKLVLVYCLLKEIVKAYPVSLAILGAFLLYQLYILVINPTIGMAIFTLLDVIIIWLVWGEYRDLREKNGIIANDAKNTSLL